MKSSEIFKSKRKTTTKKKQEKSKTKRWCKWTTSSTGEPHLRRDYSHVDNPRTPHPRRYCHHCHGPETPHPWGSHRQVCNPTSRRLPPARARVLFFLPIATLPCLFCVVGKALPFAVCILWIFFPLWLPTFVPCRWAFAAREQGSCSSALVCY